MMGGCRTTGAAVDIRVLDDWAGAAGSVDGKMATGGVLSRRDHIKLAGAINETVSFTFSLRPNDAPVKSPGLTIHSFSSPRGSLDASNVRVFRRHGVEIHDWPGWHIRSIPPDRRDACPLDVLVPYRAPRGGMPATLQPGETYYFWVDLTIPKGTPEATYTTEIEISSEGEVVAKVVVDLTVWPFVLPDEADTAAIAELDHRALFAHHVQRQGQPYRLSVDDWRGDAQGDELGGLLRSSVRMLQSHRLTPVLHGLAPIVKVGAKDGVTVDWGQYDAVAGPLLDGRAFYNRVPLRAWPLPVDPFFRAAARAGTSTSSSRGDILPAYLARCAEHFSQKGWLGRSFAMLDAGRMPADGSAAAIEQIMDLVGKVDDRIAIVVRSFPQDLGPYGWVDPPQSVPGDSVDIWMPPAQFFDADVMAGERAAGKKTWMAVDRPPFSGSLEISAPVQHVRVLARQAKALGAEALFVGCVNRWPDSQLHPIPEDCIRADPRVLLYPGGPFGLNEPVPSARLKYLRRSLQDAAYDVLLTRHGLGHVVRTLRESLSPYAGARAYRTHFADGRTIGWVDDPRPFELARQIMARELIAAVYGKGDESRSAPFDKTAAWRQFMLSTRKLKVYIDGARVRLSGPSAESAVEVECTFAVENRTRVPVAVDLRFAELPTGWSAPAAGQTSATIPPDSSRRVRLAAKASAPPASPRGYLILPVELTTDDGAVRRLGVRVSCISAQQLTHSIRVDGDLSDWPAGATNVASDFILITGEKTEQALTVGAYGHQWRRAEPGLPARPQYATLGFVMHDAEHLYIGITCETNAEAVQPGSRRKSVRYEDMIPVGEELVEILIDPYNTGTRSPSDLFHIVVKQSGVDLTERGVQFDPPCGTREPWPVDIEVAASSHPGRWSVELRVPLTSFGVDPPAQAMWGFNITRFDLAHQEFSTWSGAVRNAYDPLSLGNLHLEIGD